MHYPSELMLICVRWYAAYPLKAMVFSPDATRPLEISFSGWPAGRADRRKAGGGSQTHKGGRVRCEGEAVARQGGTQFPRGLVSPAFAGALFGRPAAATLLFLSAERDHLKTGRHPMCLGCRALLLIRKRLEKD